MANKMMIAHKRTTTEVIMLEQDIPVPSDTQILLKVYSCGVCGGDLINNAEYKAFGHEMAGIVQEIGSKVTSVKVGDRVAVESSGFCGVCDVCKNGRVDLCRHLNSSGGAGFAEYAVVPATNCIILPDDITYAQAGIIEPLGVAIDLVKTAQIELGDHVLIYGTGTIGLMALQLAKKMGATKIYAVLRSRSKKKAELAKKFGADDIIYSDKMSIKDYKFPKGGVDKALVTAHNCVIPETLDVLNFNGTCSYIGFGGEPMITFNANQFHVRKLQLKASFAAPGIFFPLAIETIQSGVIDTDSIISHTMPLSKIKELMEIAGVHRDEVVKAVMVADWD